MGGGEGGGGDRYHLGGRIGSSLRVRGGGCDVEVGLGVGGGERGTLVVVVVCGVYVMGAVVGVWGRDDFDGGCISSGIVYVCM